MTMLSIKDSFLFYWFKKVLKEICDVNDKGRVNKEHTCCTSHIEKREKHIFMRTYVTFINLV